MFFFEDNILEEVYEYKYLGINFNNKRNWEDYRKKRTLRGSRALYALQNKCKEAELWDWKMMKVFFGLLVCRVILYGCEL